MRLFVSEGMINHFLSGLLIILILIAVGYTVAMLLRFVAKCFPFSRFALTLALTPLCLIQFLEQTQITALFIFAMALVLFGITVDAASYLLNPKSDAVSEETSVQEEKSEPEKKAIPDEKPDPGMIVWEKAE